MDGQTELRNIKLVIRKLEDEIREKEKQLYQLERRRRSLIEKHMETVYQIKKTEGDK